MEHMWNISNCWVLRKLNNRFALGTVQFGLRYGVANSAGQVSPQEATAIVCEARAAGFDTLDTASAYGNSEQRLGEIGVTSWRVVSKLPHMPRGVEDVESWVVECVGQSLRRLRIPKLHGLLVHRSQDLLTSSGGELYRALVRLKSEGYAEKIGVSVYGPAELDELWPKFKLDLIQAPLNVIDRRLATSGWLKRLRFGGAEIHARSAFLQGLLLMEAAERPARFDQWRTLWEKWQSWLDGCGMTPLEACLAFALSYDEVDRIVVGVDNVRQLHEIIANSATRSMRPPEELANADLDLIDPSRWGNS
jgi:aryl-alcohol dehydrogenase-like predicted oxidoreductase